MGVILPLGEVDCAKQDEGGFTLPTASPYSSQGRELIRIPPLGGVVRSTEGGMGFTLPALWALPSKEGNSSTVLYSPPMGGEWEGSPID